MRHEIKKEYNTTSSSIKVNMEAVRDHLNAKEKIKAEIVSDAAITGIIHVNKGWIDTGIIFENNARQPEKMLLTVTTDTSLLPVGFSARKILLEMFTKPPKKAKRSNEKQSMRGIGWRIYILFFIASILASFVFSISNNIRAFYNENKSFSTMLFWGIIIGIIVIVIVIRKLVKKLEEDLKEFMVVIIEEAGIAFEVKFSEKGDQRCWKCFTLIPASSNYCPECSSKQK
ncbi:MAG: hypothetical protein ACTSYA_01245 [Candidatus Kariarchaeaceae archaeon]